jgi:hypothetical protein
VQFDRKGTEAAEKTGRRSEVKIFVGEGGGETVRVSMFDE